MLGSMARESRRDSNRRLQFLKGQVATPRQLEICRKKAREHD